MGAKFSLGQVVITRGALGALTQEEVQTALRRHAAGDWGELGEADREENERSLQHAIRLLSSYKSTQGEKFWVITERDCSVTTILLPEEY